LKKIFASEHASACSLALLVSLTFSLPSKKTPPPPFPQQLEGLKRLCEASLASSLTVSGLRSTYELSEAFSAPQLGRRCVLFALEKYDSVSAALEPSGFCALMRRMVPKLRESLTEQMVLRKKEQQQAAAASAAAAAGAPGPTGATAAAAVAAAALPAPAAGGAGGTDAGTTAAVTTVAGGLGGGGDGGSGGV
jgi:hypothetical protein